MSDNTPDARPVSEVKRYVLDRNRDLIPAMREVRGTEFLTGAQYVLAADYDAALAERDRRIGELERRIREMAELSQKHDRLILSAQLAPVGAASDDITTRNNRESIK